MASRRSALDEGTPRLRRFSRRWMHSCGGSTSVRSSSMRRRRWRRGLGQSVAARRVQPADRTSRPPPPAPASPPQTADARAFARRSVGGAMRRRRGRHMYKPVQYRREQPGRRRRSGGSGSSGAAASSGGEVERASPPRARVRPSGPHFLRSRIRRITEAEDSARTDDRGWSSRSPCPASDSLGSCRAPPPPAAW